MINVKDITKKYFEILNKQDYDTEIAEDIEEADTIEHFNEMLDLAISEMSQDEIYNSLKQGLKRDLSKGQGLFEEDEIWDELNEWIDEQREV